MKKIYLFLLLAFSFSVSFAQEQRVEMADLMREEGKIYVVVGVLLLILLGVFTYLILLDKKLKRLEKSINN